MAILNFGFTKILVEKSTTKVTKQINVKSDMGIKDITESDVVKGTEQKAFLIKFEYSSIYEPKIGQILIEGELIYLANKELAEKISKSWKEKNALPKEIGLTVFNRILHQSQVEALIMSKEINLPPPIQLSTVKEAPKKK